MNVKEGYGFISPRSRERAQQVLKLADELKISQYDIRTIQGGYVAPIKLVQAIEEADAQKVAPTKATVAEDGPETVAPAVEADAEVEEPKKNASHEAWIEYAKTKGYDEKEGLDRSALIKRYGV